MRILITNNRLDARPGGAESFVQDLARGLQELGHSAIGYTSDLEHRPRMIEEDLLPLTTNPAELTCKPDIIHGQHHLDAITAILALPGVPAIYHCHGANWLETQPMHPRIYRYVSVSRTLAERMRVESNLSASQVEVIPNGVNLDRFRQVRALPAKPRRALFYHKSHYRDDPTVKSVEEATARHGISLDFIGRLFGRVTHRPEETLPQYDLVFASGRSAIDALVSGCAVIVLSANGAGPLVTPGNYDHFHSVNFQYPRNATGFSSGQIAAQIEGYDAAACASVTARLRQEADFRLLIPRYIKSYEEAIRAHGERPPEPDEDARAASGYLRTLAPLLKRFDQAQKRVGVPLDKVHLAHDLQCQLEECLRAVRHDLADEPPKFLPEML